MDQIGSVAPLAHLKVGGEACHARKPQSQLWRPAEIRCAPQSRRQHAQNRDIENSVSEIPVMFPPGRLRVATRCVFTGSPVLKITVGTVLAPPPRRSSDPIAKGDDNIDFRCY